MYSRKSSITRLFNKGLIPKDVRDFAYDHVGVYVSNNFEHVNISFTNLLKYDCHICVGLNNKIRIKIMDYDRYASISVQI